MVDRYRGKCVTDDRSLYGCVIFVLLIYSPKPRPTKQMKPYSTSPRCPALLSLCRSSPSPVCHRAALRPKPAFFLQPSHRPALVGCCSPTTNEATSERLRTACVLPSRPRPPGCLCGLRLRLAARRPTARPVGHARRAHAPGRRP
jgi:hypothetical protein